jgi:hypothetical protein
VPLVFYQGEHSWSYSTEFADLFAESVREWPEVPRFSHGLIDQSGMQPEGVQGKLKTRLMQLLLITRPWLGWNRWQSGWSRCHHFRPVAVSTICGYSCGISSRRCATKWHRRMEKFPLVISGDQ